MKSELFDGLREMGFIISKKDGEPYVIDRLDHGEKIFGRQITNSDYYEKGKKNCQEKGKGMTYRGMEAVAGGEKLKSTTGTYMKRYKVLINKGLEHKKLR